MKENQSMGVHATTGLCKSEKSINFQFL